MELGISNIQKILIKLVLAAISFIYSSEIYLLPLYYISFCLWWIYHLNNFLLLPLTHCAQGLKGLHLLRSENRNKFGLSDNILPQEGRPTFTSITRYKAYILGSTMPTIKQISLNSAKEPIVRGPRANFLLPFSETA